MRQHLCKWKSHTWVHFDTRFLENRFLNKNLRSVRACISKRIDVCCSNATGNDPCVTTEENLTDARVIYAVAPAMGHNQVRLPVPVTSIDLFFFKGLC